jgi:hypothetical protein
VPGARPATVTRTVKSAAASARTGALACVAAKFGSVEYSTTTSYSPLARPQNVIEPGVTAPIMGPSIRRG